MPDRLFETAAAILPEIAGAIVAMIFVEWWLAPMRGTDIVRDKAAL